MIVEFSLENSEKVNILHAREKKRKQIAEEVSRTAKEVNSDRVKAANTRSSHQGTIEGGDKKRKRREGPGERRKRKKMQDGAKKSIDHSS